MCPPAPPRWGGGTSATSPGTLRERWTKEWPGRWRRTGHSIWLTTPERDNASLRYGSATHKLVAGGVVRLPAERVRRRSGWPPGPRRQQRRAAKPRLARGATAPERSLSPGGAATLVPGDLEKPGAAVAAHPRGLALEASPLATIRAYGVAWSPRDGEARGVLGARHHRPAQRRRG